MLVSDKYGFIIATPVKTGTTTLLGMANNWTRQGGSSKVLRALTGDPVTKHRMAPVEAHYEYDRYMTVRDPYTRLPSMYEWMRKWPHPAAIHNVIWDAENRKGERRFGWKEFIKAMAVTRAASDYKQPGVRRKGTRQPYMWTDTQEEHFNYLWGLDADGSMLPWYREEEPGLLGTESLMGDFHALLSQYDVDEDDLYELKVPHLNRSRDRLAETSDGYWALLSTGERRLGDDLMLDDREAFGFALG